MKSNVFCNNISLPVRAGIRNSLSLNKVGSEWASSRADVAANPDRIKLVQEAVHGVTIEECQVALHNHSWNVQKAVHYLKVEQLFCLGLKSRVECHKILEMCDWNLELASTQILDSYGSVKQRR